MESQSGKTLENAADTGGGWTVDDFRLHYELVAETIQRPAQQVTVTQTLVRLVHFRIVPTRPGLGELLDQALQPNSRFQWHLSRYTPAKTTVSLGLSDSFGEYNRCEMAARTGLSGRQLALSSDRHISGSPMVSARLLSNVPAHRGKPITPVQIRWPRQYRTTPTTSAQSAPDPSEPTASACSSRDGPRTLENSVGAIGSRQRDHDERHLDSRCVFQEAVDGRPNSLSRPANHKPARRRLDLAAQTPVGSPSVRRLKPSIRRRNAVRIGTRPTVRCARPGVGHKKTVLLTFVMCDGNESPAQGRRSIKVGKPASNDPRSRGSYIRT
jgi:hypothetical protein